MGKTGKQKRAKNAAKKKRFAGWRVRAQENEGRGDIVPGSDSKKSEQAWFNYFKGQHTAKMQKNKKETPKTETDTAPETETVDGTETETVDTVDTDETEKDDTDDKKTPARKRTVPHSEVHKKKKKKTIHSDDESLDDFLKTDLFNRKGTKCVFDDDDDINDNMIKYAELLTYVKATLKAVEIKIDNETIVDDDMASLVTEAINDVKRLKKQITTDTHKLHSHLLKQSHRIMTLTTDLTTEKSRKRVPASDSDDDDDVSDSDYEKVNRSKKKKRKKDDDDTDEDDSDSDCDDRDYPKSRMQPSFKTLSQFKTDTEVMDWLEQFNSIVSCVGKNKVKLYYLEQNLDFKSVRKLFAKAKDSGTIKTFKQAQDWLIEKYKARDSKQSAFRELQAVRQTATQSVDEYWDHLISLFDKNAQFGKIIPSDEKLFYLMENCLTKLAVEIKRDTSHGEWDVERALSEMRAIEDAQKLSSKAKLNIMTTELEKDEEIVSLKSRLHAIEQRQNNFQYSHTDNNDSGKGKGKNKKPFVKNPNHFYSANMKQFYVKNGDESKWKERCSSHSQCKCPSDVPHLYNKDKFKGQKACILCHTLGDHTPDACPKLTKMRKDGCFDYDSEANKAKRHKRNKARSFQRNR